MRKAFTLIELLVAIAIIGILSSLAILNFNTTRANSRDARRSSDVKTYAAALEKYRVTHGSYFVATTPGCASPSSAAAGCVGAEGKSYGRMNFVNGTEEGKPYAATSIAQALVEGGYITQVAHDPLAQDPETTAGVRDYVLVRCMADGSQATTTTDDTFSIWTAFERTPSIAQTENTARYCGGSLTGHTLEFASTSFTKLSLRQAPISKDTPEILNRYFAASSGPSVVSELPGTVSSPTPSATSTPTAPPPSSTLVASVSANPVSGVTKPGSPFRPTITATYTTTGTVTGDVWYLVNCGIAGKAEFSTQNPTITGCEYPSVGTYTVSVRVEKGGLKSTDSVQVTALAPEAQAPLQVVLTANPSSGTSPFTSRITATVTGGNPNATLNYTFYCDRGDTGTNITSGWVRKQVNVTGNIRTLSADCPYSSTIDVIKKAKVIVESESKAVQAQAPVTVQKASTPPTPTPTGTPRPTPTPTNTPQPTPPPNITLGASLTATPTSGTISSGQSFSPTLNVSVFGSATGTPSFRFNCGNGQSETTTSNATFTGCRYTSVGTFPVIVTVSKGGKQTTAQTTVTTSATALPLTVTLTANPNNGTSPFNSTITASVSGGDSSKTINYTFYCDRRIAGTNITAGHSAKFDGQTVLSKSISCPYTNSGSSDITKKAKVIIERGNQAIQKQVDVVVRRPAFPPLKITSIQTYPAGGFPIFFSGVGVIVSVTGGDSSQSLTYSFGTLNSEICKPGVTTALYEDNKQKDISFNDTTLILSNQTELVKPAQYMVMTGLLARGSCIARIQVTRGSQTTTVDHKLSPTGPWF